MAMNGSASVKVTNWDELRFSWFVVSQSAVNNTSTVEWSLSLIAGSSGRIDSSVSKKWKVVIDGQIFEGENSVAIANNTNLTIASDRAIIKHADDGSKNFEFSFNQEFNIVFSGSTIKDISGSGEGEIDTIAQTTIPTVDKDVVDMGTTLKITTKSNNKNFKHDLFYKFGNVDWAAISSGVGESYSWKVPMDLAYIVPHKTSGSLSIKCVTKSGEAVIGEKILTITANVPATVKPKVTVTVTEKIAEYAERFGFFVQYKSILSIKIDAESAYGSPIESYRTQYQNKTYTINEITTDAVSMSGEFLNGVLPLTTEVTDKRGRTSKVMRNIVAEPYSKPTISNFTAVRCNANGETDDNGEYIRVNYKFNVAPLQGKNMATVQIGWNGPNSSAAIPDKNVIHTETLDGIESQSREGLVIDSYKFNTTKGYKILLKVTDYFGSYAIYADSISSSDVIMDISADGKGVSFFEFCEKPGVTIRGGTPSSPTPILEGADLDELIEPGFYAISASVRSSVVNGPPVDYNTPASIEVVKMGELDSGAYELQQIGILKGALYMRAGIAGGNIKNPSWNDWDKYYNENNFHVAGKTLWSGSNQMGSGASITFSEKVSEQRNGIVLVFNDGNTNQTNSFFVPKVAVAAYAGSGHSFFMVPNGLATVGYKYIYLTDTRASGNANNTKSGTADSGLKYDNSKFYLRYVYGV